MLFKQLDFVKENDTGFGRSAGCNHFGYVTINLIERYDACGERALSLPVRLS